MKEKKYKDEDLLRHQPLLKVLVNEYRWTGLEWDDLFSEAQFGLMKALEHFDRKRGKFSSYVKIWVKSYLDEYISSNIYAVSIPIYTVKLIKRFRKSRLSIEEFAAKNKFSDEQIDIFKKGLLVYEAKKEKIEVIYKYKNDKSLNIIENKELVNKLLNKLKSHEQAIFALNFGLADHKERDCTEIGDILGKTRQWTWFNRQQALKKLRT